MSNEITIGDLARQAGVNIETIRYYERAGLMPRPARTSTGRRKYDEAAQSTLMFIRKARELGFHIEDTRALLALRGADDACPDAKAIAARHLDKVRAEMRRTIEIERMLSDALSHCPGNGPASRCSVLNALERSSPAPADRKSR